MKGLIGFLATVLIAFLIGTQAVVHVECGMCGAHVSEWWYVQGASGSPVEVCRDCYLLVNER